MPSSGVFPCAAITPSTRERPARLAEIGIGTGSQPERGQDVPVRRIAGLRDGDTVARLEHRKKCEDESAGGAGGDRDARGINFRPISFGVVPRDAARSDGMPSAAV